MSKNIKFFYRDINRQSNETSHFWKDHKDKLSFLYSKSITYLDNLNKVIILGIGNGEDLPLKVIADSFQSTTLLDIDKETLLETKDSLPREIRTKVKTITKDLTNADDKYTEKYAKSLLVKKDPFIAKAILNKLFIDESIFPQTPLQENFQLVISSTVSTQLVTPFTLLTQSFHGMMGAQLHELCAKLSAKAVENHVTQIENLLESKNISVALITSEQYVWSIDEEAENGLIGSTIEKPEEMLIQDNQNYFEEKGLVIQGRITKPMLNNFDILYEDEWLWKFNESRQYLVKGWIVRKPII